MVCAPGLSIILSLKLGDYLSVQTHKPCFISHLLRRLGKLSRKATLTLKLTLSEVSRKIKGEQSMSFVGVDRPSLSV